MKRLFLRLSNTLFFAILFVLCCGSAVYGQTATYTLSGTLSLQSGMDPLGLNGDSVTATAILSAQGSPTSSTLSSSETYNGATVSIALTGKKGGTPLTLPCSSSTSAIITDNVGAPDSIMINNCTISVLGLTATINATATVPDGYIATAVPTSLPLVTLENATVNFTLTNGDSGAFGVTGATLSASGSAPPTITANPSSWTPTATIGSTMSMTQLITLSAAAPVSFTAIASGGSWLSVGASEANTFGPLSITVNPTGLTQPTYSGSVTLTVPGGTPVQIPVTLTMSAPAVTLGVQTPLSNFAYTIGLTPPASQMLTITSTPNSANVSAAVTSGNSWLSVSGAGGATPATFTVSIINLSSLTAGTQNGNIQITSAGATNSPLNVAVTLNVTAPTLTVPTGTLTFNYTIGGTAPAAQPVSISGTSGITFTTSASSTGDGGAWLAATPSAGSTVPGSVSVSIATAGLTTPGTFSGSVLVTSTGATGSPASIPVTINVTGPTLTAGPTPLNFSYQIGSADPMSQSITVGGTSGVNFTATAATSTGGGWLSVTPSGTTPDSSVTVSVDPKGLNLAANTYNGTITIAATGATSQVVNVVLTVTAPTLTVASSSINFAYQTGGTTPNSQSVNVGGTAGQTFTATAATMTGGSWLGASASGTTPGSVTISLNSATLAGLAANTYSGTVTVAATGAISQVIDVTLVVSSSPTISASPSSLSFTYTINGSAAPAQPISVGGSAGIAFTATAATTSGGSWLSATPSGTTPASVSVSVNALSLPANTYHGTITIACAPGGTSCSGVNSQTVGVTLVVSAAPTITVSSNSLTFNGTVNSSAPGSQSVNVSSSTPVTNLSIATEGGSWLSARLSAAATPAVVTISASQANLLAGTYSGSVVVSSSTASNSPQVIAVQFVVAAPITLTAAPSDVNFAFVIGGSNPPAQSVSITSTQPVTVSASNTTASWLSFTSSGVNTPATITISVNPASLAAGTYMASISVSSSTAANSPLLVPVSLVVSNKPTLAVSPSSLTFSAPASGSNPASQSINLTGTSALQFTVATAPSWLSASVSSQTTPATLIATVNTKGMNQGTYSGSITVTSPTAGNSPLTIPVTLNVTAPLVVPGPTISAIVNGASYDTTGFSPGAIVTVFGTLLGPTTGVSFSVNSKGDVDSTLTGATVTVNGISAIPIFVQSGQVNVILPFNLPTSGTGKVEVEYNDLTSAEFSIPLAPADVQIFTANASGSGPGSILNQDYSVNTKSNPAAQGSVIQIYGTGAGVVTPTVTAGGVAGDKLSNVALPYSATVNGQSAKVLYAGTAPGLVYGVDQFNIQLPASVPSGAVKVVLTVGTSQSQSDVTVFVK